MTPNLKKFYIGVKGVIVNTTLNQALVLLKTDQLGKKYWDIPGGRINDDEDLETSLKRELQEEVTNLKEFAVEELLNAYRLSRNLKEGLGLMLLFYKVTSDIERVEISDEHEDFLWVSKQDLASLNGRDDAYVEEGYLKALELARG